MKKSIELALIPNEKYSEYRYNVIFKAYKWDPQVGDHNTDGGGLHSQTGISEKTGAAPKGLKNIGPALKL